MRISLLFSKNGKMEMLYLRKRIKNVILTLLLNQFQNCKKTDYFDIDCVVINATTII